MEMQSKEESNGIIEGEVGGTKTSRLNFTELALRILAMVLTLTAAVLLGINKQSTNVSVSLISSLPTIDIHVTAKWIYLSAFVYFVVANAIACSYAAMSSVIALATCKNKNKKVGLLIVVLDLVMVGLLFSAVGATGAVGLLGRHGNDHLQWQKVCYAVNRFCNQVEAAAFLSFTASIAYMLLIIIAFFNIQKKS